MQLLSKPNAEHLLDASLESLHNQSLEWMEEIDFTKYEMSFFYDLLRTKGSNFTGQTAELAALEKELVNIADTLGRLQIEVSHHEKCLALLFMLKEKQDVEDYRKTHHKILSDLYDLHVRIKMLKKNLFSFVQRYDVKFKLS